MIEWGNRFDTSDKLAADWAIESAETGRKLIESVMEYLAKHPEVGLLMQVDSSHYDADLESVPVMQVPYYWCIEGFVSGFPAGTVLPFRCDPEQYAASVDKIKTDAREEMIRNAQKGYTGFGAEDVPQASALTVNAYAQVTLEQVYIPDDNDF